MQGSNQFFSVCRPNKQLFASETSILPSDIAHYAHTHLLHVKATAHESQIAEQNDTRDIFLSCAGKFCMSIWRHEAVSK